MVDSNKFRDVPALSLAMMRGAATLRAVVTRSSRRQYLTQG